MEKRFQVFISSTFIDLKDERKAIIESLLNARYIPTGMEVFSASSDEQFKYIKKIIDDCDYYILILKNSYGSVSNSTGISYTEMEYNYALERKIPILAFVYRSKENIKLSKTEKKDRRLFWEFRNRILNTNRLCKMWDSSLELIPSVISSLNEEVKNNPQIGWIRPDIWEEYYLINEINNLRRKKDDIENELEILNRKKFENIKFDVIEDVLTIHGIRFNPMREKEYKVRVTLKVGNLFNAMGKDLEYIKNVSEIKIIILEKINLICESCFTCIDQHDISKIVDILCNTEYVKKIINGKQEYIGLTLKGKHYFDFLNENKTKLKK